jgi:hypothetical protein
MELNKLVAVDVVHYVVDVEMILNVHHYYNRHRLLHVHHDDYHHDHLNNNIYK